MELAALAQANFRGTQEPLREPIARLAARLCPGRWLLTAEDPEAFAVGLFALAHANAIGVVPPNTRPGTLRELGNGTRGRLVDGDPQTASELSLWQPAEGPAAALSPLDPERPLLELFTSGSTGQSQRVPKTLNQLALEVDALERCFGESVGGTEIVSTVSHNHLYGLLFRLLWPLRAERPFASKNFTSEGELFRRGQEGPDFVLVSSPAFLSRVGLATWQAVAERCVRVFSSGGPLDESVGSRIAGVLGHAPTEILGSTETGGVAWRVIGATGGSSWRALPGVAVSVDAPSGRLCVRSAFVSSADGSFVMGDRARIEGESFALLGRADRVVKVGEKPVALAEMEAHLEEHPGVARAALVQLQNGRIGAVVVPADQLPEGREARISWGRALRDHLGKHWAPVTLPRAWRYVSELPENEQGKLPAAALLALFEGGGTELAANRLPIVEAREDDGRCLRLSCRVPDNLACLEGHFPERPIVPGVAQLDWVVHFGSAWIGNLEPAGFDAVKWKGALLPGHAFELELLRDPEKDTLRFAFTRGEQTLSTGRLEFT